MSDVEHFALLVLVVGAAIIAAVLLNRISERIRIPAPAIFLVAAALASDVLPALGELSVTTVQRIVSVALAVILFDGGMHIGWQRFRSAAGPVLWVGVAGTFLTATALAVLAHVLFGLDWRSALLVGTALAPTDPAVVFSVLGRREVAGCSGTILEGEAGANDPVGIAVMASLLTAGPAISLGAVGSIAGEFLLQLAVGAVVGVAGGALLVRFMRRVPLPSEGLYPLRVLACALVIYGAATVVHGSGFLAVFIAGILVGDARAPYKGEIERFHAALASLAEIVAFLVLGLTVGLHTLPDAVDRPWPGGAADTGGPSAAGRPAAVAGPAGLGRTAVCPVGWAQGRRPDPARQLPAHRRRPRRLPSVRHHRGRGGLLGHRPRRPRAHCRRRLGVPMRTVEPEPWSLGVRFRQGTPWVVPSGRGGRVCGRRLPHR
jgi:cell volume regulation protein A